MIMTFNQFVAARYNEYSLLKKYYPSSAAYREDYVDGHGFDDWLNSLNGKTLNFRQTISLVMAYIKYGNRKTSDLPIIFSILRRLHQIEFPVREGIFTAKFWDLYLEKTNKNN